jgi:glutamate formiminotransferase
MVSGEVREEYRAGVAYSGEQAKGIAAFCELSHILPIFNEGWESDFGDGKMNYIGRTIAGCMEPLVLA